MTEPARTKPDMARALLWLFAAIGGAVALGVVAVIGALAFFSLSRDSERAAPAQVAAKEAQPYTVQEVEGIRGTNLAAITIGIGEPSRNDPYSMSGGGGTDRRNLVLLDKATGANRRLLPANDRRIIDVAFFPAAPNVEARQGGYAASETVQGAEAQPKPSLAPMAYYVIAVRRKDGKLQDLLVGNLATGAQAWLLTGLDGVDRMWMIAPTRLGVLLRQGLKLQYRVIDIPALKIVAGRPVEIG
ncbi:MAG: hypothetical protein V4574_05355 [Pseudomonadota bacterium]